MWFGLEHGRLVGPEELRRDEQFDGELVTLDDLRQWTVPSIKSLPNGTVDSSVRYLVNEIRGFLVQDDKEFAKVQDQLYFPGSYTVVYAALRSNYRLPPELANTDMLSLFNFGSMMQALIAALGIREAVASKYWEQWEQQTRPSVN